MPEQRKVVTQTPENSETPLDSLRSWVTPNRLFFVRNHFDVPDVDLAGWQLAVEGYVARRRNWSWDELIALPERTVFATVECAGNGRSFLQGAAGVQWGAGAIGHAEWTGVPLRTVLERSGIQPGACEVLFEGRDRGSESDHPEPMAFARSLPLAKALDPDTLLAYRMNGETLEPSHGFPLRLFAPGWYGVASVKWLSRIEVLDRPFRGYFQTKKYTIQRAGSNGAETVVVGPMAVKSEIIRPPENARLGLGTNRISGVAWAGEQAVTAVEVSTDGGQSWNPAELVGLQTPYSWTLWEYLWESGTPGRYTLLARTRSGERCQPDRHDPLLGGYMIHFSRPRPVQVEEARQAQAQLADLDTLLYDMNAYAEFNSRLPLDVEMEFAGGEGI
jgi:DMSO/TMAO reductase YedYZ molybdopterin-dependent catalytic subunit